MNKLSKLDLSIQSSYSHLPTETMDGMPRLWVNTGHKMCTRTHYASLPTHNIMFLPKFKFYWKFVLTDWADMFVVFIIHAFCSFAMMVVGLAH